MLMIAILSVGASACFIARFAFRILFVMASAFFCMLGHHDSPPTSFLNRSSFIGCANDRDFHQEAFYVYVKER